jgi:hypothetical protein
MTARTNVLKCLRGFSDDVDLDRLWRQLIDWERCEHSLIEAIWLILCIQERPGVEGVLSAKRMQRRSGSDYKCNRNAGRSSGIAAILCGNSTSSYSGRLGWIVRDSSRRVSSMAGVPTHAENSRATNHAEHSGFTESKMEKFSHGSWFSLI